MKLQYEILALGLKPGMQDQKRMDVSQGERYDRSMAEDVNSARQQKEEKRYGLYHKFSNYFVNDKENLKDIMQ